MSRFCTCRLTTWTTAEPPYPRALRLGTCGDATDFGRHAFSPDTVYNMPVVGLRRVQKGQSPNPIWESAEFKMFNLDIYILWGQYNNYYVGTYYIIQVRDFYFFFSKFIKYNLWSSKVKKKIYIYTIFIGHLNTIGNYFIL